MSNYNTKTGLRFGVIAFNSLDPDVGQELFHGPGAVDLSYKEAYEEAKREAHSKWESYVEEAEIAANEVDGLMSDADRESFIESKLFEMSGFEDEDEFVEEELQRFSDLCEIYEPHIEGEYEGITYQITWLGGAPLVWSFDGPTGWVESLCSPCVPGAADLDSGYTLNTESFSAEEGGHLAHCFPREWLA